MPGRRSQKQEQSFPEQQQREEKQHNPLINDKMRELATLSMLITPQLQIAPQERQRARHTHVTSKPVREPLPLFSPMEQREREAARRKEIERQRDILRDEIVQELQDKYLDRADPNLLFPERKRHNQMHQIQFPMKPFLPVEVTDDGYGLTNFPRQIPEKQRCKKYFSHANRAMEVEGIFASSSPEQFASERSAGQQQDLKHKMLTWRRRQNEKGNHAVPDSIFEGSFNNLRSGASSIETKRGIPKHTSLLPLSGLNASEATMLGPNAPYGAGRTAIYQRAPHVLENREKNYARHQQSLESCRVEPRTEYERMLNDTANCVRAKVVPVRGIHFRPPVLSPRNREVITHDADVMELSARKLPMPPDSMRRVQILSTI
jgi:hypothetical protein